MTATDVFINCPFDDDYKPLFHAMIYATVRSGHVVRSALEADNSAENRLEKICSIIAQCPLGIHDISCTKTSGDPPLPRFNMPLELGLFLGARKFGGSKQKSKSCIIFDSEKNRFQRFISDIGGQDIRIHGGEVRPLMRELSAWFRLQPGGARPGGGGAIADEYDEFKVMLPSICSSKKMEVDELEFGDFNLIVREYIEERFGRSASF